MPDPNPAPVVAPPRRLHCFVVRAPRAKRPQPATVQIRLTPTTVVRVPAPAPAPDPFEVRIRAGLLGAVHLVGHDHDGQVMIEVTMKRAHLSAAAVTRLEEWCREFDESPAPTMTLG